MASSPPRRRSPACQPSSVNTQGTTVVALFLIARPGLYVVGVSGATPATTGNYALNLTVAGDFNGDGNVDGNDSALLAAALGSTAGSANYSLAADINGDGKVNAPGRGHHGQRLRLPRHDRLGDRAAHAAGHSTSTSTPPPRRSAAARRPTPP